MWFYRVTVLGMEWLLLAQQKRPRTAAELWKTEQGVKALAALAGLVILGFGLVFLTYMGGRFTRHYMNSPIRNPPPNPDPDDWARGKSRESRVESRESE